MKASIFSAPMEDLEDAPIFQRPIPFRPNWRAFNRPLSESERFHLSRLEASDGLLTSSSNTGTELSPSTENEQKN